MRHKKHSKEDNDNGNHVENKDIFESSSYVLTCLFGVGAEPEEVPVGEQEDDGVHDDVDCTKPQALPDLDNTLDNGHYGAGDVEHAHNLHSFVDLDAKTAGLRFLIIWIVHHF